MPSLQLRESIYGKIKEKMPDFTQSIADGIAPLIVDMQSQVIELEAIQAKIRQTMLDVVRVVDEAMEQESSWVGQDHVHLINLGDINNNKVVAQMSNIPYDLRGLVYDYKQLSIFFANMQTFLSSQPEDKNDAK